MTDSNVTTMTGLTGDFDVVIDTSQEVQLRPPMVVQLDGRRVEFMDPDGIDWLDLLLVDNPVDFIRYSTSREDREYIFGLSMKAPHLEKLMKAYQDKFDLDASMEAARRKNRLAGR